jgi:hypothetical protein
MPSEILVSIDTCLPSSVVINFFTFWFSPTKFFNQVEPN